MQHQRSNYFVVLLAISLAIRDAATLEVDDPCVHNRLNSPGICKSVGECPQALQELAQHIFPETCGFDGTVPIVCCPSEQKPDIQDRNPQAVGMKSYQKCKEYAKLVNVTFELPTLSFDTAVRTGTRNECGFKAVKLIVGGTRASDKEFPHMAAIGYDNGPNERVYVCGGSLISENFVLTAAHCLKTRDYGDPKYVRVGDTNLKDVNDADPQELNIAQIIRHPEYRTPSQYNDIGLLRLESNVRFTAYVRPICLHFEESIDAKEAIATGWGSVAFLGANSDYLLKVTLTMFGNQQCRNAFPPNERRLKNGIVENTQLCAGSKTERKDTCQGDSGGPLQIYHLDEYCMYSLIGVTSFGKACGIANNPGVYTRVSHYIDWIEKIVWP
ncbi:PREDICTED: venom protease-like [Nicrophorus vespilloides]|uniref:Venom protease-like n=1 Tax=Nicrophorus vespilloides TaxID=110193 RepID=A0ABM1MF08_NICVS|nr:PREDICTED: venom protease-like [Nicrophorus vespilloides]